MDIGSFPDQSRFGYNKEGFVIPLITLTDDITDAENDDDDDDIYSIEELENAVFSDNEDDLESDNIRITEPETELKDFCQGDDNGEDETDIIGDQEEQELSSPELEERAIPISLESGRVLLPQFTSLGELGPPEWSIFHKRFGTRRSGRNINITLGPEVSMTPNNVSSKPVSSGGEMEKYEEKEKPTQSPSHDIEDIFGELNMLGKLPLSSTSSMDQDDDGMDYENLGDLNESNDEIISIPVKTFNFDTGTSAQEKTQIPASKFVDATSASAWSSRGRVDEAELQSIQIPIQVEGREEKLLAPVPGNSSRSKLSNDALRPEERGESRRRFENTGLKSCLKTSWSRESLRRAQPLVSTRRSVGTQTQGGHRACVLM